jgi:hypothetical protein
MLLNSFYRICLMSHIPFRFLAKPKTFGVFVSLLAAIVSICAPAQNKNPSTSTAAVVCSAADFKALAFTINDAQVREERAKEWIAKYGKSCSIDQIEIILSNQAVWLGTADTPAIISSIESIYKQNKAAADAIEKSVDKPKGSASNRK